jgi:O-antigen ligase
MTKKKLLTSFETVLAIVGIAFYAGAFGFAPDNAAPILPKIVSTLLRYSIWLASGIFLVVRWKGVLRIAKRDVFLCLYIALLFFSFAWAAYVPRWVLSANIRDVLQVVTFGLYFATSFSLKEQIRIIALAFGLQALASVLVTVIKPSIGIHILAPHSGSWKGLYNSKNGLSTYMVLWLISLFSLSVSTMKERTFKILGICLATALILLSRSTTGIMVFIATVSVVFLLQRLPRKVELRIAFICFGLPFFVGIILLIGANWVEIAQFFGKDSTLTGRIPLWTYCLSALQDQGKVLLGFGRGQFFMGGSKTWIGAYLASQVGFFAPHPHNGFINIVLDTGLVGLLLFMASFFIAYMRSLTQVMYVSKYSLYTLWPICFLTFFLLNNLTETLTEAVILVIYMSISFSVGRHISVTTPTNSLNDYSKKVAVDKKAYSESVVRIQ